MKRLNTVYYQVFQTFILSIFQASIFDSSGTNVIEVDLIPLKNFVVSFPMDFFKVKINSRLFLFSHVSFKRLSEKNHG